MIGGRLVTPQVSGAAMALTSVFFLRFSVSEQGRSSAFFFFPTLDAITPIMPPYTEHGLRRTTRHALCNSTRNTAPLQTPVLSTLRIFHYL